MSNSRVLSYSFCKKYGVIANSILSSGQLEVIHRKDTSIDAIAEAQRMLGMIDELTLESDQEFNRLLSKHFENNRETSFNEAEKIGGELNLDEVASELAEPEDLLESDDDAPIIRLINALITEAIKENASDIHVEPFETRLSIRFRVDGVLREVLEPPRQIASLLCSRIKVMAQLDIAEKRLPQDGRISLKVANRPVDIRVSTLPSGHGERVVMRILDKQAGRLDLHHLGMSDDARKRLSQMIQKPHGILLVTGPTGSGKTTTLYAILSAINDARRNILTVEDPVEYDLDGIGQTPVNTKVDMTFAKGLRAILRQDPDVVMVGEIRDTETAQIAVQASLTGHLVLSTLHTNSAVGAITRLQDMGVEPFLLSSTLLGVISQRLVRNLCCECRSEINLNTSEYEKYGIDANTEIFHPEGCPVCLQTGYRGRSGIYELVEIDDNLSTMIHDGESQAKIEQYCRIKSPSIRDDGMRKITSGETSLDEVLRVTRENL
ncbi:MAG: type II secretion system ATPase GspE [Gammaproteobacteria bacterium]|nr:type II secretion system ATPase GspE [Gammaproteobacteria bacterium]